jgi:hypothetical protein
MSDLQLIAISGDMSKGGLSDTNTIINIDYENKKEVDTFLKNQNHFHNKAYDKSFPNKSSNKAYDKYVKSFLRLKELGIFTSKYDFRTTWEYTYK